LSAALNGIKKGGILIGFLRCHEGLGDINLPKVSPLKGFAVKHVPMGIIRKGMNKYAGPPDQSGGSMDIVKLCRNFDPYIYSPSIVDEINLKNLGLKIYDDVEKMMEDVI